MLVEEKTITLRKPITIGKDQTAITYSEIELREPSAGELEKAQAAGTTVGQNITLVSLIAKIPRSVVEKFSQRDLMEASDFFGAFYASGEVTAEAGQG